MPPPGLYKHDKSGKIVLVRGVIMLQDDTGLDTHGPYDGEKWTLYEHDGKAYARKPEAFCPRFSPYDPTEGTEDVHAVSLQTYGAFMAGLSWPKRLIRRLANWCYINAANLVGLAYFAVPVIVINVLTQDWMFRCILYATLLAGTYVGTRIPRQPISWGGNGGPPITLPFRFANALHGNEWVPMQENLLGGLGGGDFDQGPVDYKGPLRCPRCLRHPHEGHKDCVRGTAISWLHHALHDASQ